MRKLKLIAASFLCGALVLSFQPPREQDVFLEKPYLQIGDAPGLSGADTMMVLWQTGQNTADWKVEVRTAKDKSWRAAGEAASQVVSAPAGQPAIAGQKGAKKDAPAPPAIDPHIVYRARLTNLVPGGDFQYRVRGTVSRYSMRLDMRVRVSGSHSDSFSSAIARRELPRKMPSRIAHILRSRTSCLFLATLSMEPAASANTGPSSFPFTTPMNRPWRPERRCCGLYPSSPRRETTIPTWRTSDASPTLWRISCTGTSRSTVRRQATPSSRHTFLQQRGRRGGVSRRRKAAVSTDGELFL